MDSKLETTEAHAASVADDDLSELEFAPLPPEDASELENRLYLPGARHGVRPL
ncbi:MAG TPA: hypothetical protein VFQ44_09875 [Streptosporangiaceae bacterium]|nr:hypothetical protein [Streptosporangiaceae bacterium]